MKNNGIAKDASCSPAIGGTGGGGGTSRIHFGLRGSHANGVTAFGRPKEAFCEVNKRTSGFTLIELLITMSILGLIASFAMPSFITSMQRSKATTCLLLRHNIQVAADNYVRMNSLQVDDDMPTLGNLVSEGLLLVEDQCPSGGIYVWNDAKYKGIAHPFFLYCSIHFAAP